MLRTPCSTSRDDASRTTVPLAGARRGCSYRAGVRSCSLVPMCAASSGPSMVPSGLSALALAMVVRMFSRLSPIAASRTGLTRTRIAGCSAPLTLTSATPWTCDDALRDHGIGDVVDRARLHRRRGQRQDQDRRRRRIGLAERRQRRQVAGQVGQRGVQCGLHVARGALDAAVEVELDGDVGVAERARRGDLGDARRSRQAGAPAARRPSPPWSRDRRRAGSPRHGWSEIPPSAGSRPAGNRRRRADQHQPDREKRGADRPTDEGAEKFIAATPRRPAAVAAGRPRRAGGSVAGDSVP